MLIDLKIKKNLPAYIHDEQKIAQLTELLELTTEKLKIALEQNLQKRFFFTEEESEHDDYLTQVIRLLKKGDTVKKMNKKNINKTNESINKSSSENIRNKSIDEFIYMGEIINKIKTLIFILLICYTKII